MYTRRQAGLLLILVVAAGLGVAIGHWRRGHPDLADTLERFDHVPPTPEIAALAEGGRAGDGGAPPRSANQRAPSASTPAPSPRAPHRSSPASPASGASSAERRPSGPKTAPAEPLDLNQATADELTRLPGIGPVLAARIVAARETGGPFASVDDLRRVGGVGAAKLERVRALVTVSP